MGYLKISNLYKNQTILLFKECYVLEKVHGTSAHVSWKNGNLTFFSGGEKYANFLTLFDQDQLKLNFTKLGYREITIYGEAYGGKMQGMRHTYGDKLKFIVFDVKVGDNWLSVPDMAQVATQLGFEVVPWETSSTNLESLDAIKTRPSEVAVRCGITEPKVREGVVLRPLQEMTLNNGDRVIAKYKNDEFEERSKTPKVKENTNLEVLENAEKISQEWVTEMRLQHVLGKLELDGVKMSIEDTHKVIMEMIQDVNIEAKNEILETHETNRSIGKRTAKLFKQHLQSQLKE